MPFKPKAPEVSAVCNIKSITFFTYLDFGEQDPTVFHRLIEFLAA